MAKASGGKRGGAGKKMTHCEARASHRKAQNKYVAKDPKAQAKRVQKSEQKQSTKGSGSGGKGSASSKKGGQGKHGHTTGRPRKAC